MIIKNEEKYLERCLSSAKEITDEIVIVDTGSTDNSKQIAQSFGAKTFDYKWCNDFSAARNFALEKSTGDWILYLDADEEINQHSIPEIQKIKNTKQTKAFNCKIRNVNEFTGRESLMTYPRLFPNIKSLAFQGKVHEQILTSLKSNNIKIENSNIEIIHYGYNLSKEDFKKKAERNLKLLLDEYACNKSPYVEFQIGQTYNILENGEQAAKYFQLAVKDKNLERDYLSTAHRVLSHYYLEKMNMDEAANHIEKSIQYDDRQPVSFLHRARLNSLTNQKEKCFSDIEKVMNVIYNLRETTDEYLQIITISEEEVFCEAIKYSLMFDETEKFKFYFSEYEKRCSNLTLRFIPDFIDIIKSIAEKKKIPTEISGCKLEERHLEIFILLIKKLNVNYEIYFSVFENWFNKSFLFNKEYGMLLLAKGELELAEEKLSTAQLLNDNDPSVYFFLLSVFISKNQIDKAKKHIEKIESKFSLNKQLLSKINMIKEKLFHT